MSGIALGLVDNQFIHGEIGLRWCSATDSELVIIVDDALSTDKLRQGLMDMQIIDTITARYYSIERAITKLPLINQKDKNSLVIFDSIDDLVKVVEAGVDLNNIVISSLPIKNGKKRINHSVALTDEEIASLLAIEKSGTPVFINSDPDLEPTPLDKFI
ncbi:PTS sugar transporter subunit IIB [Aerococcaceae bacterium DSM 111020]|nr:PTS sugar transporter subunit IIB [Aerococcaceae bacterium DSM 111020]